MAVCRNDVGEIAGFFLSSRPEKRREESGLKKSGGYSKINQLWGPRAYARPAVTAPPWAEAEKEELFCT